jgi:hypothetical protein
MPNGTVFRLLNSYIPAQSVAPPVAIVEIVLVGAVGIGIVALAVAPRQGTSKKGRKTRSK